MATTEDGPPLPDALERHQDTSAGRMRSRSVGEPRDGVPEVILVQGMAVADYLMPAVAELGRWTRAHLVELPGFAGSGEPARKLDVPGYAGAVVERMDPRRHPRDFGSFGRFHRQLAAMPRSAPPAPLTLEELDLFLAGRPDDAVSWDG
jgi:hypothetical protein